MRLYRGRLRKNVYLARVEMRYSLVAKLIELGYLSEQDAFDYRKRGDGFMRYLDDLKKGRIGK